MLPRVGDRIKLLAVHEDARTPRRVFGRVQRLEPIEAAGEPELVRILVVWDDGRNLSLLSSKDEWQVVG